MNTRRAAKELAVKFREQRPNRFGSREMIAGYRSAVFVVGRYLAEHCTSVDARKFVEDALPLEQKL